MAIAFSCPPNAFVSNPRPRSVPPSSADAIIIPPRASVAIVQPQLFRSDAAAVQDDRAPSLPRPHTTVFRIYLQPSCCPESGVHTPAGPTGVFPVLVSAFHLMLDVGLLPAPGSSWLKLKQEIIEVVDVTNGLWRANTELIIG